MRLFFATGTCSLFPHIVASEIGIPLDLEHVDISKLPRFAANDRDYSQVNPKLYVPALELDDGEVLTEGVAIAQYLVSLDPGSRLIPAAGTHDHYRQLSWLTFVSSELHKAYSPWLFHAEYGAKVQNLVRKKIATRLAYVDQHLSDGRVYLMGDLFTAADAYLFTIVGWSPYARVDLAPFPHLRAFMVRVAARPAVHMAMQAQGLKAAA